MASISTKALEANVAAMKTWDKDPVDAYIKKSINAERSGKYKKGSMISTDASDWYTSKDIEMTARRVASLSFLKRFEDEIEKRKKKS